MQKCPHTFENADWTVRGLYVHCEEFLAKNDTNEDV